MALRVTIRERGLLVTLVHRGSLAERDVVLGCELLAYKLQMLHLCSLLVSKLLWWLQGRLVRLLHGVSKRIRRRLELL